MHTCYHKYTLFTTFLHHFLPLQVLAKPSHRLEKGLLLGKLLNLDAGVAADSEAVRNARVQVKLEGLARLDENLLGLVALLGREDGVSLGSGNGQRAGEGSELVLLDVGGVSDEAGLDAALVVTDNVL
jgi:hypothetical protein